MEIPESVSTLFRFIEPIPKINELFTRLVLVLCCLHSGLWCSIISGTNCSFDPEQSALSDRIFHLLFWVFFQEIPTLSEILRL